jgi:iron complex transport system substrate-binding protein
MRIWYACSCGLALALAAAAGARAEAPGAAAGGAGSVEAPPRIVSLSPHITELLFAAGAGDRIVGVDDESDYPAAAASIARVGEISALDVEGLLKLKPTLVILWDSGTPARRKAELERLNLRLYVTEQRHLDDIESILIEFGRLAGTSPVAIAAARKYRQDLDQLRAQYAGRRRLTVFYQVWDRPLYTLSGAHVVSEMLSLCGGDNVFADLSTLAPAPAVDKEAVLARNPDVIIIGANGAEGARQVSDWSEFPGLRAVQTHRVYTVDPSLTGRMAPRILEGVAAICSLLDRARE